MLTLERESEGEEGRGSGRERGWKEERERVMERGRENTSERYVRLRETERESVQDKK